MKSIIVIAIPCIVLVLLFAIVWALAKNMRNKTMSAGMAKFLAVVLVFLLMVLFVFMMGFLKTNF